MSKREGPSPRVKPIIGPPAVLLRATAEAERLGRIGSWKIAFTRATPDAPLLVERLDVADTFYYIVAFRRGTAITARVSIDAETGEYDEAVAIDKAGDTLPLYATADQARKRVSSTVSPRTPVSVHPFLVWQPCSQSLSVFLPFYRVQVGARVRYYRVDGKLYDELTFAAGQ